jgi:phosphoribosylanthranilate isomerase
VTFTKFCGMTREDDVRAACDLGVNAVGFVMWPKSTRYVDHPRVQSLVRAITGDVIPVAVLVRPTIQELLDAADTGIKVAQVYGVDADTLPSFSDIPLDVWVATSLDADLGEMTSAKVVVLDAHDPVHHGGTGRTIDWTRAAAVAARRPVMLAGGLTPANVNEAIRRVRPYGVDVASGIEERPGVKDARAMQSFVAAVREADA